MKCVMNVEILPENQRRYRSVDFENLKFGKLFSDHMLEMHYKDGVWNEPTVKPYSTIAIHPSLHALHYGQSVFEGMKAYYSSEGTINIFRPWAHFERLTNSCRRMCMPEVPEDIFLNGLKKLVELDWPWVPKTFGHALYIRPLMFASQEYIAAVEANEYRFYVITSPVAAYYESGFKPVKLTTSENYVRAVSGGTGSAKAAGNYGGSFLPARLAKERGFTQVLWLDAKEGRYVEEVGTMNIFFLMGDTLVTPELDGAILPGVIRRSVIQIAQDWGMEVQERKISIDEVMAGYESGQLKEVFGTGTAAVIAPVGLIDHQKTELRFDMENIGPFAQKMYQEITGIQYGKTDDRYGWNLPVTVGGM